MKYMGSKSRIANEKLFVYKGGLSEKDFNNRL